MLYFIGLGLSDPSDITVKGLNAVKTCSRIFLDAYTSILTVNHAELEEFFSKKIELADRELVEQGTDIILSAKDQNVAFLVVGDPFGATTHTDLVQRAIEHGIPYEVIHNASIMNAIGCCGLQLYCFGETVSIPFWDQYTRPESFFDKTIANFVRGLHTLCLLDIKVKEQSIENILRGKKIYEPPRFMTCQVASSQILDIISTRGNAIGDANCTISGKSLAIGVARVGSSTQKLLVCSLEEMNEISGSILGGPLHSLVVPGMLHPVEVDVLSQWIPDTYTPVHRDALFKSHCDHVNEVMEKFKNCNTNK